MRAAGWVAVGVVGTVAALAVIGSRPSRGRHRKPVWDAPVVRPEQRDMARWN